jgi:hypothetical protein
MNEMLNIFEIFWDIIGFPQKAVVERTFKKQKEDLLLRELKEMIRVQYPENGMKDKIRMELSEEDMEKKTGDKGTFVVKIRYRQNSTWQGHVTWVEENKTVPFRSALELLKLLDSAQEEFPEDWTGEE